MDNQEMVKEPVNHSKGSNKLKVVLFLFVIIFIFFYVYIRYIEPQILVVQEYPIVDHRLPQSFHGLKIVHFSDLLYGSTVTDSYLEKVADKINRLKPDIVIYTGDLFNESLHVQNDQYEKVQAILKSIQATRKKYAVIGDQDYKDKELYISIMENADFNVLDNSYDFLYYEGNAPLLFLGTSSLLKQDFNAENFVSQIDQFEKYYSIWLNHEPIIMDQLKNQNINLIFTGHTLGGLVKFPFQNYLLKQEGVGMYTNATFFQDDARMYISNGLGTYKFNVRFGNLPSISFYRLYSY